MALTAYEAVYEAIEEFGEEQIDTLIIKTPKADSKRPRTRLLVKTKSGKNYEYVCISPGIFSWKKRILV